MRRHRLVLLFVAAAIALLVLALYLLRPKGDPPPAPEVACRAGAWRLADGELVVLTPLPGTALRYRLLDGRTGRLAPAAEEPGGMEGREGWRTEGPFVARARFGGCDAERFDFALEGGPAGTAERLPLRAVETRFAGAGGTELAGRLTLPAGDGPVPLAVLVHGSERTSALTFSPWPALLATHGIAAFAYDKRGTGSSEGSYTQDFSQLADDAVAALAEARRLAPGRFERAGFVGGSQGGWIGPLAASRSGADFVVALYGLADSPLAEDRDEVLRELRARGHGADVEAAAREVTAATGGVIASRFRDGYAELARVKKKYRGAPWLADVQGEYSGDLLRWPGWVLRLAGPFFDQGTSWEYDPLPTLTALAVPQLWVLAGADREAPPEETVRRLRGLQEAGRPIDLAIFPATDHGIVETAEAGGRRVALRHAEGYFRLVLDWIHAGSLGGPHGQAELYPRR